MLIKTARSSHRKCFICNRTRDLKKVTSNTIANAYIEQRIYIKSHSRCCSFHLKEDESIKPEYINSIVTNMTNIDNDTKKLLDAIVSAYRPKSIFDHFKNINTLTDKHCKIVTGWPKATFIKFSRYITSNYNNKKRNKYELIALYRFWLRNGTTQQTLTFLKNDSVIQRDISRFLDQIRQCIYKDFVPYYLGVNRNREFFIKQNNETVKTLHDMKKDELAVFADGSYTRIEKSMNSNFQYKSFSQHKHTQLIKPFLLTCSNGYVIDVYGPFEANLNDEKILRYVLETDLNLKKILLPNKTLFFIDRGKKI